MPENASKYTLARFSTKVRDCTKEEILILVVLLSDLVNVPVEKMPTGEPLNLIVEFIIEDFPNTGVDELYLSFREGLKGSYDNEKKFDMKHYHSFDYPYITSIYREYKNWLSNNRRIQPLIDLR